MKFTKSIQYILIMLLLPVVIFAEGGSNDPQITITPSSKNITEGNSGTKSLNFTVSISECPTLSSVKVKVQTTNGTAKSGSDYIAKSQDITFNTSGVMGCIKSYNVTVKVKGDNEVEKDETFNLMLSDNGTSSVQKYHWGNQNSTVTIKNDDSKENNSADLSITKSNDYENKKAEIGDIVTYTIVAKNNGPKKSKIHIWDTLPKELKFVSVNDSINNYWGFSDDYDCEPSNNNKKITCDGEHMFDVGESVTITVKAKVLKAGKNITNYAGANPKDGINDPNSDNDQDKSSFSTKMSDLSVDKEVKKSGDWKHSINASIGDILKFKLEIKNLGDAESKINFKDTFPSNLIIQNMTYSKDGFSSGYNCNFDSGANKITCSGSHKFEGNDKVTIIASAKVNQKGYFRNTAYVSDPDNKQDANKKNNYSYAIVKVDYSNEKPKNFKKVASAPTNGVYTVGDIVTFNISGKVSGSSRKIAIRDYTNKKGTTDGAFKFISANVSSGINLNCELKNKKHKYEYVSCSSKNNVNSGDKFNIDIKFKLLKSGNVCNRAHFYKSYPTSDGDKLKYLMKADSCIDVKKKKEPPVLDAEDFHFKLNVEDSVDLKDFTNDPDTNKNDLTYTITGLPDGLSMTTDGTISGKYTDSSGTFPKEFSVTVTVTDPDGLSGSDTFKIIIDAEDIVAYDNYYEVTANGTINGNMITDKERGASGASDEGQELKVISVEPTDPNFRWKEDGSFSYKAPNSKKEVQFKYIIKDKYGQTDYALVKINVTKKDIKANDDVFNIAKDNPFQFNVFVDNGHGADVGDEIKIIKYTKPQDGTIEVNLNGTIKFKPTKGFTGEVSFTYTIQDKYGNISTATVYIKIEVIRYEGYADFKLINPPETRNMVGNYIVVGNSVSCITNKRGEDGEKDSFKGQCQTLRNLANNDYVVKYIDQDNNEATWNSSSTKFTLPNSYLEDDNKSIAWAGLFWQGSINNKNDFKQRRAIREGNKYTYFNTDGSPVSISKTDANKLLIKVDNSNYVEVEANTLYNDLAHGDFGGYYAGYTNVTDILQKANLKKGEHTITVANITTNEGREGNVGNYAGWSLVIIYKEDITGKPRNISIYNGYQALGLGGSTNVPKKEILISGFKLPKSGDVDAKMSAFVGEGELAYGGTDTVYDKMYIKDILKNKTYNMPVSNPNNIFDSEITTKATPVPSLKNTNGIDIDSYDVSSIIKDIRDNKPDTSFIIIGLASEDTVNNGKDSDYVTASMLAFSTQLYAPKMCYDYNVRIGDYINIPSIDRNFTVSKYADKPLRLNILLRSEEADFDLIKTKLRAKFTPNNSFSYKQGRSEYTPPNTSAYLPALETNKNKGQIAVGKNVTIDGGTIGEKETTYAKLYYNFTKDDFSGRFDLRVDAKISFDGINEVPYKLATDAPAKSIFHIDRCDNNPTYDPVYGIINIERGDSKFSQAEPQRYSLYTQVVGVPYEISVAGYKKDSNGKYTVPNKLNTDVEVELIDAGTMENNSSLGFDSVCRNPDSYSKGVKLSFYNEDRKKIKIPDDYPNYPSNLALKNATFRAWVLTYKDINGTRKIANYHCGAKSGLNPVALPIGQFPYVNNACYKLVYARFYAATPWQEDFQNGYCQMDCAMDIDPNGNGCYQCLRKHYGMPICARDNFAIRPDSYSMAISDINQTKGNTKLFIGKNDGASSKNLSAGYTYNLDINATKYHSRDKVIGYYFISNESNNSKSIAETNFLSSSGANCPDTSSHKLNITMYDGKTIGIGNIDTNSTKITENAFIVNSVGNYLLHIEDKSWTEVDQKGYPYKPFKNRDDCIQGSNDAKNGSDNAVRGCVSKTGVGAYLPDLPVTLHPYKFDLSSIAVNSNPNSNSKYLYIANIDRMKDQVVTGNLMALNINGTIKALGKNGAELQNYTNGCMARDLNVSIAYKTDPDGNVTSSLGTAVPIQYYLYDSVVDKTLPITQSINDINAKNSFDVVFNKKYFYAPATANFNAYMNMGRTFNNAINPFHFTTKEFNVSSPTEVMTVDMNNKHIPTAKKDLNTTKIFYYAKVKSKSDFYDDIYDDSINTPVEVTIFCNEDLAYCAKYGIDTYKDSTNEYDWFIARNHNAASGKAIVEISTNRDSNANSKFSVAPQTIQNFTVGIDKSVKVSKKTGASIKYPYTVYIKPQAQMVTKYPYLLFNKNKDSIPDYLWKNRFVKQGGNAWSGKGKTGFVTDYNSTGRRTKKVDW